jgi:hypothetical protein
MSNPTVDQILDVYASMSVDDNPFSDEQATEILGAEAAASVGSAISAVSTAVAAFMSLSRSLDIYEEARAILESMVHYLPISDEADTDEDFAAVLQQAMNALGDEEPTE